MKRKIDNFFIEWKNDTAKKPLILFGPSQSGKTYSTINFAKNNYKDYVYINSLNLINKKRIVSNNLAEKLNFRESIEDTLIILDNVIDVEYFEICKKFYNDKYNIIIIILYIVEIYEKKIIDNYIFFIIIIQIKNNLKKYLTFCKLCSIIIV